MAHSVGLCPMVAAMIERVFNQVGALMSCLLICYLSGIGQVHWLWTVPAWGAGWVGYSGLKDMYDARER